MKEKNVNITARIICVGLAYLGFEYDSGWAFAGSVIAFFNVLD